MDCSQLFTDHGVVGESFGQLRAQQVLDLVVDFADRIGIGGATRGRALESHRKLAA